MKGIMGSTLIIGGFALGLSTAQAGSTIRTTYDGTTGMYNKIFNSNSQERCLDCHSSGFLPNWATYAGATAAYSSGACPGATTAAACGNYRVQNNQMPTIGALNSTEKNEFQNWLNTGSMQYDSPYIAFQQVTSVGRYNATFWMSASENGSETSFYFGYKLPGASFYTYQAVSDAEESASQSVAGSDGNGSARWINHLITSLSCGTTYNETGWSNNSGGTYQIYGTDFTTAACPVMNTIPNATITEDQNFSYSASSVNASGMTVSYSLDATSVSRGISINSSTGAISWSAASTPDAPVVNTIYTVTVYASYSDSYGGSNDQKTFNITVTPINDSPTISDIANQSATNEDALIGPLGFTISDVETAAGSLVVSASSNNQALVPNGNIVLGGSAGSRTISVQPAANQSGSATITVSVSDGSTMVNDLFTVTVNAVNDAPVMSVIADQAVTELSTFSLLTSVTDPDDPNDGSGALTYSFATAPPVGMTISNMGLISWTPSKNTAGVYSISVRVADGGENGAAASTQTFQLTVNKLDTDGDGVADYADNCVGVSNVGQTDFDGDKIGDACDLDEDDDGIPDTVEKANSLDPMLLSDARDDKDSDGYLNVAEYRAGTLLDDSSSHPASSFKRRYDSNRDYSADIVWRNSTTGEVSTWLTRSWGKLLNKYSIASEPNSDWHIVGIIDTNGDARSDIIWRNVVTGDNRVWRMTAQNIAATTAFDAEPDLTWDIVAVGDFDGDGKGDILWRNSVSGANRIWFMNGAVVTAKSNINSQANLSYSVIDAGDTNGDGKADILWFNSSTGAISNWTMNGATRLGSASLGSNSDPAWQVRGVGDFDGDGKVDVVWRNNGTGQQRLWLLDGINSPNKLTLATWADVSQQLIWVGDVDGDGKADLTYKSSTTDKVTFWLLNGVTVVRKTSPGTATDLNAMH